jgi:hypothetical protein
MMKPNGRTLASSNQEESASAFKDQLFSKSEAAHENAQRHDNFLVTVSES